MKLKSMFLDDRAKKAGAESNPLYTTAVLSARNTLRTDVRVIEALDHAWVKVKAAFGTPEANGLSFGQYCEMSRKLYLAVHAFEASYEILPSDFAFTLQADWLVDAEGASVQTGTLEEAAFKRSWYELADVHTDGVDAVEYATYLRKVTSAVIAPFERGGGWRSDADLLDQIKRAVPSLLRPAFNFRRRKWEEAFPPGYTAWKQSTERRFSVESMGTRDLSMVFGNTRNWPRLPVDRSSVEPMLAAPPSGPMLADAPDAMFARSNNSAPVLAPGEAARSQPPPRPPPPPTPAPLPAETDVECACGAAARKRSTTACVLSGQAIVKEAQDFAEVTTRPASARHTRRALPRSTPPCSPRHYSCVRPATAHTASTHGAVKRPVAPSAPVDWPPPSSGYLPVGASLTIAVDRGRTTSEHGNRAQRFNGRGNDSDWVTSPKLEPSEDLLSKFFTPASRPSTAPLHGNGGAKAGLPTAARILQSARHADASQAEVLGTHTRAQSARTQRPQQQISLRATRSPRPSHMAARPATAAAAPRHLTLRLLDAVEGGSPEEGMTMAKIRHPVPQDALATPGKKRGCEDHEKLPCGHALACLSSPSNRCWLCDAQDKARGSIRALWVNTLGGAANHAPFLPHEPFSTSTNAE